jgi:hypothetical protein
LERKAWFLALCAKNARIFFDLLIENFFDFAVEVLIFYLGGG